MELLSEIGTFYKENKDLIDALVALSGLLMFVVGIILAVKTHIFDKLWSRIKRKPSKHEEQQQILSKDEEQQEIEEISKGETSSLFSILKELKSLTPVNQTELAKTYYGRNIKVRGTIFALTIGESQIEPFRKEVAITLDVGPKYNPIKRINVFFRGVSFAEYPQLKDSRNGDSITVEGIITKISTGPRDVELGNVKITEI